MELSSFWSRYPLAQSQLSKAPDRDLIVRQQSMGCSIKWLILTSVFICLKTPFNVVQESLRLRLVSFFR